MKNIYYVYEWIRLDTNEPFYVGKGKNDRWRKMTRGNNKHFNNIVKSKPVAVNILHDNLDENTAYEYEIFYINEYKNMGFPLVNISDGGSDVGCSSKYLSENNYYRKTPKGKRFGEKPVVCLNYDGDKPKFYNSLSLAEDEYPNINISKCCNGVYKCAGKNKEEDNMVWVWLDTYNKLEDEDIYKMIKNANSKKVICLNDGKIFSSASEAGKYYKADNSCISKVCNKLKNNLKGLCFMWYYDYLEQWCKDVEIPEYTPQNISVICLETKETFDSMREAERFYGLKKYSVSNHINRNGYKNGIFSYKEDRFLKFERRENK